jgi:hypothetical protein
MAARRGPAETRLSRVALADASASSQRRLISSISRNALRGA